MNDEPQYRVYGITRMLENLPEPATKEAQENGLSIRLSQWAQGGEFGWVFDNESDTFDISNCDNFGIDGTGVPGRCKRMCANLVLSAVPHYQPA